MSLGFRTFPKKNISRVPKLIIYVDLAVSGRQHGSEGKYQNQESSNLYPTGKFRIFIKFEEMH